MLLTHSFTNCLKYLPSYSIHYNISLHINFHFNNVDVPYTSKLLQLIFVLFFLFLFILSLCPQHKLNTISFIYFMSANLCFPLLFSTQVAPWSRTCPLPDVFNHVSVVFGAILEMRPCVCTYMSFDVMYPILSTSNHGSLYCL